MKIRTLCTTLVGLALAWSAAAQTTVNGAGATFPYPTYSKWFDEYHKQHPDIQINYQSIGSARGRMTAGSPSIIGAVARRAWSDPRSVR